ncbi:alpha/beta hydrolase family protein [Streptomyces mirabilis]|uniref:alpha/beta hydrolase family protein n=1 Tax=Streptomyces mirabilis TaxID=68239 RepID=UPI0033B85A23
MKQLMFHDDPPFWFETLRNLGLAAYGGSDVGEVIATAARVTPGDYDSWHDAWLSTAERLEAEARGSHPVSARDGLLRASSYYRAAEFFLHGHPEDPRIDHAYERGVSCFRDAIAHFPDVTPVEIPYEDTVLHGYFYRAAGEGPRPAVVMHNGFDGAAEELHFSGALGGQERGYHVLTFDGPGQPAAIHRDGPAFRPDWENVVGPVLDFLTQDPGVDPARTALLGVSLGGYLAPRAAAYEPRLAAVVALDGVFDAVSALTAHLALPHEEAVRRAAAEHDEEMDRLIADARARSPILRWAFDHGRYVTRTSNDREFLAEYARYSFTDGSAGKITCPVLVCEATDDLFYSTAEESDPRKLYRHLTAPKTLLSFTEEEGGDAHCHRVPSVWRSRVFSTGSTTRSDPLRVTRNARLQPLCAGGASRARAATHANPPHIIPGGRDRPKTKEAPWPSAQNARTPCATEKPSWLPPTPSSRPAAAPTACRWTTSPRPRVWARALSSAASATAQASSAL